MVNPDGVIFGNYRSNLMGYDLNRKWDVYDKEQCFPEVTCIKQLITELENYASSLADRIELESTK